MRVSGYTDGDGSTGAQEHPDESRHALSETTQNLECQRDGINVRAVVGDNREGENDQTEVTESAKRRENSAEQTPVT